MGSSYGKGKKPKKACRRFHGGCGVIALFSLVYPTTCETGYIGEIEISI